MRIIKVAADGINGVNDINRIAGEMINIEASTFMYVDGKLLAATDYVKHYPKLLIDNAEYRIKTNVGTIYISGMNHAQIGMFINNLLVTVSNYDHNHPLHLNDAQTIFSHYHTNIKVASPMKFTFIDDQSGRRLRNVKRLLVTDLHDWNQNTRFIWLIQPISQYEFSLNSNNIKKIISGSVCSIFYDYGNICTLGNNDVTYEFSKQMLRGNANMCNIKIPLTVFGNPLGPIFNKCRSLESSSKNRALFRNLKCRVFQWEYSSNIIKVDPRRTGFDVITDTKAIISHRLLNKDAKDICVRCHSELFDDNYVLCAANTLEGIPICPWCLHGSTGKDAIESHFNVVYRVTFPKTIYDMIDERVDTVCGNILSGDTYANASKIILRDICYEALKGIKLPEIFTDSKYILVGDKYLGMDKKVVDNYLFSNDYNTEPYADRKIFTIDRKYLLMNSLPEKKQNNG